jgi:ATP-dependent helicase HrpB
VQFLATCAPAAVAAARVAPLPDVGDAALLATLETWLAPWIQGISTKQQLACIDAGAALRSLLDSTQARFVEKEAPTHFVVPSGSRVPIDYEACVTNGGVPVVEVRLQEMFGFSGTPNVVGVPLCLSLLSPASREVARTSDLASFWSSPSGYASVRRDLRGRYPKHHWPDDPLSAAPTAQKKKPAGAGG